MKPKLLLIDDEEGIRKILGLSLRDAGYEVITAADGIHGLEYLRQENPPIVLTDIKMPGMDGMEVLQRIKSISPDTEVIMITGHGEMDLAIKSLQLEASDFITKPIHDEALLGAIRRAEEKLALKNLEKRYHEDLNKRVKEANDQLMRTQKELLQAERLAATGETVAGMAHAIKNILSGLKGGRYMVNQGFESNEMKYLKEGWEMVERNIEKISGLTKNLLTLCREREPEQQPVNPNDLIRETFGFFQSQCQQKGILLHLECDETLGLVNLDPQGIQEVLTNLTGNAVDACTLGEPAIPNPEITLRSGWLPEERIVLEVKDNGIGISEEVGQKLFNLFFSTKGSQGTGLGLLLSRKIVEENGGEIRFFSEPRKGSIFQVILPGGGRSQ
jgi:signal transduction histidine kinase